MGGGKKWEAKKVIFLINILGSFLIWDFQVLCNKIRYKLLASKKYGFIKPFVFSLAADRAARIAASTELENGDEEEAIRSVKKARYPGSRDVDRLVLV